MEAVVDKPTCAKCGAEVREGTAFCYACGGPVSVAAPEPKPELDKTLSMPANGAEPATPVNDEDKLTKARDERKKARVSQRKPVEYTWEPVDDARLVLFAAVLITGAVLVVVAAMVFWK